MFVECDLGVFDVGVGVELWQQVGVGLGYYFFVCQVVGLGGGEVGVVVDGFFVDVDQVGFGWQWGWLGGLGDIGSSGYGGCQGEFVQYLFVLEKM